MGFALGFDFQVRFLQAITGQNFTIPKLNEIGERIYNLERLFNVREGFWKQNDCLPERFLKEPLNGRTVPLNKLLKEYYEVRNWDAEGNPTKELLKHLNLSELK